MLKRILGLIISFALIISGVLVSAQSAGALDLCDSLSGWSFSEELTLDTADKTEGGASIRSDSQIIVFEKSLKNAPVSADVSKKSGALKFWLYISDSSKLSGDGQIIISSAGNGDKNALKWSFSSYKNQFSNGWNEVNLRFSDALETDDKIDLTAVNWFRLYNFAFGEITAKIDNICFAELPPRAEKFSEERKKSIETRARVLYDIGLIEGVSDTEFKPDLSAALTREQAMKTVLTVMGKKALAESGGLSCPYTDVSDWAKPYVAFAVADGITNGISENSFDGASPVTTRQLLTFYLRMLGYEAPSYNLYDEAPQIAEVFKLIKGSQIAGADDVCDRYTMTDISYNMLFAGRKGSPNCFFQELVDRGAVSKEKILVSKDEALAVFASSGVKLPFDSCDTLEDWGGPHSIVLDGGDAREGKACLSSTGTGAVFYQKKYPSPVNAGVDKSNGIFNFWMYVSDITKLEDNGQIEIASSGQPDTNELNWSFGSFRNSLSNGWNKMSLKLSAASVSGGEINLSAVNWFRMYDFVSGSATIKIDDMSFGITAPSPPPGYYEKPPLRLEPLTAANPRVITDNKYKADDVIIADYVVTDSPYNADPTGQADSTEAINRALEDCYRNGGGTVWMPAGNYAVSDFLGVKAFTTLRGDWRDPDTDGDDYGTVIHARVKSGEDGSSVFKIGGSAGVMGVTVYYPEQSAANPIPYNFTFELPGRAWIGEINYMVSAVINCTMLNSYKGIGMSTMKSDRGAPASSGQVHEVATVKNVKGTCLKTGAEEYNNADFETWENVALSNKYWANAPKEFNPPARETLNAYTKANGTAFVLGDVEWGSYYKLSCEDYLIGIHVVHGQRIEFCGQFYYNTLKNCGTGIVVDAADTRWSYEAMFFRSVIDGGVINNVTNATVLLTDSELNGKTGGTGKVTVQNDGISPLEYVECKNIPKITREVLYNAAKAPYNAPYTITGNGQLPKEDATAAIQSALNDAGEQGGGVVYVPPGWYRINGHLTVPANVELRGSSSVPHKDESQASYGTMLFVYEGRDSETAETAPAAVTLSGEKSGIRGIRFFWPENNPASPNPGTVVPYPYAIRGGGAEQYAVNIGLVNAYYGLDFAAVRCDNHYIAKVIGCSFRVGIKIGASNEGWVENCMGNANTTVRHGFGIPNWVSGRDVFPYVVDAINRKNTTAIWMVDGDNEHMIANTCYGAYSNIRVDGGTVTLIGHCVDNCAGVALKVTGGNVTAASFMYYPNGGVFSEGEFTSVNVTRLN